MFSTADTEDISQVTSISEKPSSSSTSDAQESVQNTPVAKQNKEITFKMLLKELVICLALGLSTYGALHNTSSNISKHPTAQKFFHKDSLVTDWYRGQLSKALAAVNRADVAFVMYYAPWDAECQYVRGQFDQAAYILGDRVHFSAINCWHPGGECRLQHNKIPTWPVIMAYTVNSRGVLYKGSRDAHSMVKFLELIMTPLRRVSSAEDLVSLLSMCDAVAIGYTPLADTPKYYNVWNNVAMQSREYDTIGEICFGSVTSQELAADLGVEIVPSIRLMLWNETKQYGSDSTQSWVETSILPWIFEHFTQPVERIIPLWKKSFTFERYAYGNPILILFTPLNPLYENIPVYSLLREIAMEYYNCNNNQWIKELIKLQRIQRLLYQQRNVIKFCKQNKLKGSLKKPNRHFEVLSQQNKYPWTNSTVKNQKSGLFGFLLKRGLAITNALRSGDDDTLLSTVNLAQECANKESPYEGNYYENIEQCHAFDSVLQYEKNVQEILETTMLPEEGDPLSADRLFERHIDHFCKLTKFASEIGAPVYPHKDATDNTISIQGQACASNVTLNMMAMDSVQNHHFAEALGIDIVNMKDKTAVVILDSKHETQYMLTEDLSAKSIKDFISNFTSKKLNRMLRTRVKDTLHTHFFESSKEDQEKDSENLVEIIDLTTDTFLDFVKTSGIMSIVVVCGGACQPHASGAAARGARLLRAAGESALAGRLDARRHDLPWHYTPAHHPTLLVFPAHGEESDSRVYPASQRITDAGVVALALHTLPAPRRLRVYLTFCTIQQSQKEKKVCLRDLKQQIVSLVGTNLKYWRRLEDPHSKSIILARLEILNSVSLHLDLLHVTDLYEGNEKQNIVISLLSILANNWYVDRKLLRKRKISKYKKSWL